MICVQKPWFLPWCPEEKVCVSQVMWRKAVLVALLALGMGYLFHTDPELPARVLNYLSQSLPQVELSDSSEPRPRRWRRPSLTPGRP